MESELPDERREAVTRLASSRFLEDETVVDALCTIARTDISPSVRCAAIRVISESKHTKAITCLVAIISAQDGDGTVVPPQPEVRADALNALTSCAESGILDEETASRARQAAIRLVKTDPARDVRLAAVRLLGRIRHPESVAALIEALQHRDFGIVYEAEQSLNRLTGRSFNQDVRAWKDWIASVPDPTSIYAPAH